MRTRALYRSIRITCRDSNHDHLDEAIAFSRRATVFLAAGHQELPEIQCTLSTLLCLRFARNASRTDFDEALFLTAAAMRGHPDRIRAMQARIHVLRQGWENLQKPVYLDAVIEIGRIGCVAGTGDAARQ